MSSQISKQAFTLPEVVVTAIIVMILMIPISRIAYTTLLSTRYARDMGSAISVGQAKLESFSDIAYANIAAGGETDGDYTLAWTVTTQDSAKIVHLTISWEMVGKTRSINLNAIYAAEASGGFSLGL